MNDFERKLRELEVRNASFTEVLELVKNEAVERLYRRRQQLQESLGERPYGAEPMHPLERLAQYSEVRENPARLAEVLAESIRVKPDGRVLVPKRLVEAFRELEQKYHRGP